MTIRERQQLLIPAPPRTDDPALDAWLNAVTDALNGLPPLSVFSYTTPENNVSGIPGTIGANLNSSVSVVWAKQSGDTMTGWVAIA